MSVKIGIGFGGWPFPTADPDHLWEYTDLCESLGVDSLWLSDRVVSDAMNVEPVVALSFIAARTTNLKFGTSVLALPLRNPTVLAKEIATLDFLSGGRSLPAVGLGTEDEREFEACGAEQAAARQGDRRSGGGHAAALVAGLSDVPGPVLQPDRCHHSAQAGSERAAAHLDRRAQPARDHAHGEDRGRLARVAGDA